MVTIIFPNPDDSQSELHSCRLTNSTKLRLSSVCFHVSNENTPFSLAVLNKSSPSSNVVITYKILYSEP